MIKALPPLMKAAVAKLNLPSWVGEMEAAKSVRLLVGLALIDPEIIPAAFRIPEKEFLRSYRRRIPRSNSIATLLSHAPLENPRDVAKLAADVGLREALLQPGTYRAVFKEFLKPNLDDLLEVIVLNNVGAGMPRESVQARLRERWRELEATELRGETLEQRRRNARMMVDRQYRERAKARGRERKSNVFVEGASKIPKTREPKTIWDRLLALGRTKIPARLRRALSSHDESPDAEENALDPIERTEVVRSSRKIYSRHHHRDALDYPVVIGVAGQLGRAELMQVVEVARRMETDEDVLICVMMAGLCAELDLPKAKLVLKYNAWWIKTPVAMPQKTQAG